MANGMPAWAKRTPQGDTFIAAQSRQPNTARWDTFRLTGPIAIPQPIQFFRVPMDQIGSGFATTKTWVDTNMKLASQLEHPVAGTVNQIIISVIPTESQGDAINAKIAGLLEDAIIQFTVDDVVEIEEHLIELGGTGLTGSVDMSDPASQGYVSAPPFVRATYQLRPAITLPSRQRFGVNIVWNANSALLNLGLIEGEQLMIRVYLQGVFSRPIDG